MDNDMKNPENDANPMDGFERELQEAFARRPAPPSLKRRLAERGLIQDAGADAGADAGVRKLGLVKPFFQASSPGWNDQNWVSRIPWQKLAACLALTAVLAGGVQWHITEERRKEEAARQQVETAMRITTQALHHMNMRLAARRRGGDD